MIVLRGVRRAAARVDDQLALLNEPVRHLDRLIERAAGILTEIEHQTGHALLREVAKRATKFLVGVFTEVGHADVAGRRVEHHGGGNGQHADFVARHTQIDQLLVTNPAHADVDCRSLRATQLAHGLLGRPPLGVLLFNPCDDVAATQARRPRRRPFEDRADRQVSIDRSNRDPKAVVATFLPLAHLAVGVGIHEARMRIQRLQHAADGAVDEAIRFRVANIGVFDGLQCVGKNPVLLIQLILGQRAAAKKAADKGANDDNEGRRGQGSVLTHIP